MNDNDKQQPGQDGGNNGWARSLLVWVGIAVALAVLVAMFSNNSMRLIG